MSYRLSKAQLEEFRADFRDFMMREESGGLDKWLYTGEEDSWARLFKAALRQDETNTHYYVPHVEQQVLQKSVNDITQEILKQSGQVGTIFVRGCGTGDKITPFIASLKDKVNSVILFDLSDELLQTSSGTIKSVLSDADDLHVHRMRYDFDGGHTIDGNALGLELGGTMFNMPGKNIARNAGPLDKYIHDACINTTPEDGQKIVGDFPHARLERRLAAFAGQFTNSNSHAVITLHNNPNDADLIQCYRGEDNARFVRNIFHLINACEDIETENFDPAMFLHKPALFHVDDQDNRVVAHMTPVNIDSAVKIKVAGDRYKLKPGFMNSPINTWLPASHTFNAAACPHFEFIKSYHDDKSRIEIALMRLRNKELSPMSTTNLRRPANTQNTCAPDSPKAMAG